MKKITDYILEKFKISKISKKANVNKFNKGDKICILGLYRSNEYTNEIEVQMRQPFILKEINEEYNTLTYIVPGTKKELTWNFYINSHGYYQGEDKYDYSRTLYLSWTDMRYFLNLLLAEKVFNPKYGSKDVIKILEANYFDNIEHFKLDEKEIRYMDFSGNGTVSDFERPKDLKEFIADYYEEDI